MVRSGRLFIALSAIALVCSCADMESPTDTRRQGLAQSGPWSVPPDIEALASNYGSIGYTGAGPWVGTSGCSGGFTDGGQVLKDWVLAHYPQVEAVGGYACRPIVGNSSQMSVHGTGRAIDIHIPLDGGQADNGLGDPIANYLVEHADEMGIQMVIWDRWMWSTSREPYSRSYGGAHAHHDHLHVELTPEASRMETPWFQSGTPAPEVADCDALPADGGMIDESSPCFVAFGPSDYWRRVDGQGMAGSLLWTNAFESSEPSNWARWNVHLEEGGEYVVEYFRTPEYAVHASARYEIRADGAEETVYLDQSAGAEGWQEVGTFDFAAGADQWVSIFDNNDSTVASDQRIVVDALRLRPVGQEPPEDTEPEPTDSDSGSQQDDGSGTNTTIGPASTDQRYGTTGTDDPLPPKGSKESPGWAPDTRDDDHAGVTADGYPVVNRAGGHACSTTSAKPGGAAGFMVALIGLLLGFARLRSR